VLAEVALSAIQRGVKAMCQLKTVMKVSYIFVLFGFLSDEHACIDMLMLLCSASIMV